jgi:hypothetical protein
MGLRYSLSVVDQQDFARKHIVMAAGLCNDDPEWDEYMQAVSDARRERESAYLATLVE